MLKKYKANPDKPLPVLDYEYMKGRKLSARDTVIILGHIYNRFGQTKWKYSEVKDMIPHPGKLRKAVTRKWMTSEMIYKAPIHNLYKLTDRGVMQIVDDGFLIEDIKKEII